MKNHILVEKAKKYNISEQSSTPNGCTYSAKDGFWIEKASNIAMMKTNNPHKPTSKKCDIETGEDQKGE